MKHLILGIHGFGRKPPQEVLMRDWRAALEEGLGRNHRCADQGFDLSKVQDFDFKLVYWADKLYDEPLIDDPEPYFPFPGEDPLPHYADDWIDELVADVIDLGESLMDRAMRRPHLHGRTRWLLDRLLRDCDRYNNDDDLRHTVRDRLDHEIRQAVGRQKILLIGHSMGSVIGYEVLRHLERELDHTAVDHFVAVGSPLGFPYLTRYLELRHGENRVPATISRWSNLTDRRDLAALDVHLKDDFKPSPKGVQIEDDLVINCYRCPKNRENYHKAYGYLRTPEISRRVAEFLCS